MFHQIKKVLKKQLATEDQKANHSPANPPPEESKS